MAVEFRDPFFMSEKELPVVSSNTGSLDLSDKENVRPYFPKWKWSEYEISNLEKCINEGSPISEIARILGRSFSDVAHMARSQGFYGTGQSRSRTIPRGAGYDKESTRRNVSDLKLYKGGFVKFARSRGLVIDHLARAIQKYFPQEWELLVASDIIGNTKVCKYCSDEFYPQNGKQEFCTKKCSVDNRANESYFGGKRCSTIGWNTKTCQVCGRSEVKGLTPHHVIGKENDPGDTYLITVCTGCHQCITALAQRTREFVDDPAVWEALISLVWIRHHGGDDDFDSDNEVSIRVDIERATKKLEVTG